VRHTCSAFKSFIGWRRARDCGPCLRNRDGRPVDKIVGPGNLYVTAAKRLVAFDCSIDMLAGPTEIVVTSEVGRASDIAARCRPGGTRSGRARHLHQHASGPCQRGDCGKQSIEAATIPSRGKPWIVTDWRLSPPASRKRSASPIVLRLNILTVDADRELNWCRTQGRCSWPLVRAASGRLHFSPNHTLPTEEWAACVAV